MVQTAKPAPRKRAAKKAAPPVKEAAPVVEEAPPPVPPVRDNRRLILPIIGAVFVLLAGLLMMQLGAQERGGPPHTGVYMGDGVPGTLYLPGDTVDDGRRFPEPKPPGQRPPVIVMGHGYSSDQQGLSILARSLAKAGFAALTFDFQGHGYNPHRFVGDLRNDLDTVLDWVERSPHVDAKRIAVLGHSMGAGAGLDFSTLDPRVNTVIPVSGGDVVNDAHTPPHALFIIASGDPEEIHDDMEESFELVKARPGVDAKYVEIDGTDHVTVIRDGQTVKAIADYLDVAYGVPADRESTNRNDPRWGTVMFYALVCLVLIGLLGRVIGSVVPAVPTTTTGQAWILLVGALIVTLPLMALGGLNFLPVHAGQQVAISLAFVGAALFSVRYFAHRGVIGAPVATWIGAGPWLPDRAALVPGAIAGGVIFLLLAPAGIVIHRSIPDWERLIYWGILAALMLPFFAAFEAIVRRGGTWAALGFGVLGRALTLGVLFLGINVGVLPGVLGLVATLLVLQYVMLEIFAATCYAKGRNPAVIAVVDAIFVAWVGVMFSPLS